MVISLVVGKQSFYMQLSCIKSENEREFELLYIQRAWFWADTLFNLVTLVSSISHAPLHVFDEFGISLSFHPRDVLGLVCRNEPSLVCS